jgi:hypothetical protein
MGKGMESDRSQRNEQEVYRYFATRGWKVDKLDEGPKSEPSADFLICRNQYCFLCEVKTISSARADAPDSDIEDLAIRKRNKEREDIDSYIAANPDVKIVMPHEEWERLFGDEEQYRRKFRGRRRNTEEEFARFVTELRDYLQTRPAVRDLAYRVRFDSDNLYAPPRRERGSFYRWIEEQIEAIHAGRQSWEWTVHRPPDYDIIYQHHGPDFVFQHYSTSHLLHKSQSESDVDYRISILVTGPIRALNALEVEIHHYGVLNLAAIDQNVDKASKQLTSSARTVAGGTEIPKIVVLGIAGGFSFPEDWQLFADHVPSLFEKHLTMSAIAVLDWVPDGQPPDNEPTTEGVLKRLKWYSTVPWVMRYVVYHNPMLSGFAVLDRTIFDDRWTVQQGPTL